MSLETVTFRLDEDLLAEIDREADALGFSNRSDYLRFLLRNRPTRGDNTSEYDRLQPVMDERDAESGEDVLDAILERLERLEERLDERPARARSSAPVQEDGPSAAPEPDGESAPSAASQRGGGAERSAGRDSDGTDGAESRSLREEMEAALDGLDVPGRRPEVEYKRREAIKWAWEFIRDADGTVTTREVANSVFAEFFEERIGYSTNARYAGYGLWDGCVRDALKELPGVVPPGPRGSHWRFEE